MKQTHLKCHFNWVDGSSNGNVTVLPATKNRRFCIAPIVMLATGTQKHPMIMEIPGPSFGKRRGSRECASLLHGSMDTGLYRERGKREPASPDARQITDQ